MSRIMNSSALPSAMEQKLRQIRWRQSVLATVRAVAIAGSVLIVAMVAAMAFDWSLTLFNVGVRTGLTLGAITLSAAALVVAGLRPLLIALRLTHAASNADEEVPQLEERWTTVASFAKSKHQPTSKTGQAMLQQVTSEAVAMGQLVRPTQVARPTALRPAVLLLGACGLALAAFLATNWPQTSVLLQRFWLPTADITATQLKSVTGDIEIPRGESLDLVVELSGVPRKTATLELATGDEFVDRFELAPDENQASVFIHQLTADESFRYRVLSGDGQTPWHTVAVIDHPSLGEVRLTVTAPDYVDRPKYEKDLIPSRVRVVQGSRLELLMKPVAALERLDLALTMENDSDDVDAGPTNTLLTLKPDADGWYRFETQLIEDITFSPTLLNSHGLTNEDRHRCQIQVIPDKAPFARVISPTDEMAVAFDDVIDIKFEAHDDHGIATAELVIYDESAAKDGEEPKILSVVPIPLGDQELEKHVLASTQLDLKKLGVKEGTNISYTIRVTDTRMLEIDPDNMRAQMAEARAGESDNDPQMADVSDEGGSENSASAAEEKGRQASDPDAEKMKNMLASAGELTDEKRNEDRQAKDAADRKSTNEEKDQPSAPSTKSGNQNSSNDGDAEPIGSSQKADPRQEMPESKDGAGESIDSTESARQEVRTTPASTKAGENSNKPGTQTEETTGRKPSADSKEPANDSGKSDAKGKQTSETSPEGSSEKSGMPDGTTPESDASETGKSVDGDLKDGKGETAIASRNPDQKDLPPAGDVPSRRESGSKEKSADESTGNEKKNTEAASESDSPERNTENSDTAQAQTKTDAGKSNDKQINKSSNGTGKAGSDGKPKKDADKPSEESAPRNVSVALMPQQSESGQNTETKRQKLKITQRLAAVVAASGRKASAMKIRDRVVRIDEMLAAVETSLTAVVERNIPDADRSEQFRILDTQLGEINTYIAELRNETKEQQFAFIGLQMVHIDRTHVTPARDRCFIAIREPLGTDNPTIALHHVARAREMLDALLKRYDRVARDRELAKALDESVKMYEVYVERSQQLMNEARQNRNPLDREMAIIEVDQAYLDRYAEVATMRREMMAELGRMLGEDPRLLARYLDIVRRRRSSLRDQLSEISDRQEEVTTELSGWLLVDDQQRGDFWAIIAEMRIHAATPLSKEAAGLAERMEQALPLILRTDETTPALVIRHAQQIARIAREITFDGSKYLQLLGQKDQTFDLLTKAEQLTYLFGELDAALEQLNFEHEGSQEIAGYVTTRLLESRTVADQADMWAQLASHLEGRRYSGLAMADQQGVALMTELLRIDMLGMEDELENQFQQQAETSLPGEIADMVRELHRVMEGITFNQAAATFAAANDRLPAAESQESKALDGFDEAKKLFDRIRRSVVDALDQYDVDNPNIADLRDPTLDEFLARLEREPNIEARLGIPNRPRNLRVLAEAMAQQQSGGDLLGDSSEAARRRASKAMQMADADLKAGKNEKKQEIEKPESEMTEEERKDREKAREMQETLEKSLASIKEKIDDPKTSAEQRRKLEEMAANMKRILDQSDGNPDSSDEWERIVESEKANETLKALASGEKIPDSQWNKLLSTLDDGVWQVGGRTPPEDYRKAIERYQERIRQLMSTVGTGAE